MSTITFSIWQLFKENSNGIRWKNPVREDSLGNLMRI